MTVSDTEALARELDAIFDRIEVSCDWRLSSEERVTLAKAAAALRTPIPVAVSRDSLGIELDSCRHAVATITATRTRDDTQNRNLAFYEGKVSGLEFALAASPVAGSREEVALPRFLASWSDDDPRTVRVRFDEPPTAEQHAEIALRLIGDPAQLHDRAARVGK